VKDVGQLSRPDNRIGGEVEGTASIAQQRSAVGVRGLLVASEATQQLGSG